MAVDGILGNSFHKLTHPYNRNDGGTTSVLGGTNDYVEDVSNMAFYISQEYDESSSDGGSTASSSLLSGEEEKSINEGMTLALVNMCAFLANAMVESIQFDTCDELRSGPSKIFSHA